LAFGIPFSHTENITNVLIDSNKSFLFSSSQDNSIKIWDISVEPTSEKIYLFITGGIIQGVACIMIGSTVEIVDVAKLNISIFGA